MNLVSALFKQILEFQDFETWSLVRKNYLPPEYHALYKVIDGHCTKFREMPTFEQLKFEIRDNKTQEQICAIETVEVAPDTSPEMLLEFVKNEYTQSEILNELENFVENSIAFEDAEESVEHLQQIILNIEEKVDLELPQESMQRIDLFESQEELSKYLTLGLNSEYDYEISFSPRDLILVGGRRGQGKSITCANIANAVYERGKSAIYFTIEMDSRAILQRACSIATGVPFARLRSRNLSVTEWERVAEWWARRFIDGQQRLKEYKTTRDFDRLHQALASEHILNPETQLDVIYDPALNLSKIRAELDKKMKGKMDVGVVIVDYINQVKRHLMPTRSGQYDWTEQIEVSKALKSMAQDYEVPILTPYQTDAGGEARFAKGILDAADAAFTLETYAQEDECITFNCVKMRNAAMDSFTSKMDWATLKIGPESALTPKEKDAKADATGEEIDDI